MKFTKKHRTHLLQLLDTCEQQRASLLHTVAAHVPQIRGQLTDIDELLTEETRQHFLAEVIAHFPEKLTHLQCQKCIRDKVCWLGVMQGFSCALYFMQYSPHSDVQKHLTYLKSLTITPELLATLNFFDLLSLCLIYNINLTIFSTLTTQRLRFFLYTILCEKKSPRLLTNGKNLSIFTDSGIHNNQK
jgi:hypothetical protein